MFGVIPAFWQRRVTGGGGLVVIYEGGHNVPGVVGGLALTKRNEFAARLTTFTTFDFSDVTLGAAVNGLSRVRNTITIQLATSQTAPTPTVNFDESNGRFNTSPETTRPPSNNYFIENLEISDTIPFIINFTPAVPAFAFFATDIGDFGGQVQLRVTKSDTSTVTYTMEIEASTANGNCYFWGIVDTSGTTYTKVEFFSDTPGTEDFYGIDDIIAVPASYIIP